MQWKDSVTSKASTAQPLSTKHSTYIFNDTCMRMFGKQTKLMRVGLFLAQCISVSIWGGEKHWGGIIVSSYLVLRSSALIKTVWVHCEWRISVHTLYSIRCCQWIHNPASGVAKTDTLLWAMTAQQLSKLFYCRKCCYDIAKDDTSEFMTFDESAFTTLRTVVKLKHYAYGEGLY